MDGWMDGSSRIVSRDMKLQRTVANILEIYVKRIFLLLFNRFISLLNQVSLEISF